MAVQQEIKEFIRDRAPRWVQRGEIDEEFPYLLTGLLLSGLVFKREIEVRKGKNGKEYRGKVQPLRMGEREFFGFAPA